MNRTFTIAIFTMIAGTGVFFFAPARSYGAEVYFVKLPNVSTFEARIDPQQKKLNVVEGAINITGPAGAKLSVTVTTDGSLLTLWPTPPQFTVEDGDIRFTGGVPNGFDHEGLLFRIDVRSSMSGDVLLSWKEGSGYQNDGKGTADTISAKPLSTYVDTAEPQPSTSPLVEIFYSLSSLTSGTLVVTVILVLMLMYRYGFKKLYKK